MSMLEDRSSYINVLESAQDTDAGLGEADSETSAKRNRLFRINFSLFSGIRHSTYNEATTDENNAFSGTNGEDAV
ncbi:hypothetical protein Tco_0854199 [Tanacetum coccineum]